MLRTHGAGVVRDDGVVAPRPAQSTTSPRSGTAPARRSARAGRPRRCQRRYDGRVRVSTRGDYACRALLSLALHPDEPGPTSVRDIAERTGPPPALPRADPARPEGRRAGALEARRRRRLRPGPAARRDPPVARSSARSTARSPSATSASPTRTAPATTRASACCSPIWARRRRADAPPPRRLHPGRRRRPGPRRGAVARAARRPVERSRGRCHRRQPGPSIDQPSAVDAAAPPCPGGSRRRSNGSAASPVARVVEGRASAACSIGPAAASRPRRGRRRSGRRRRPDGRWRPGAPGSGGCGPVSSRQPQQRQHGRARVARRDLVARCAPAARRPTTAMRVGSRGRAADRRVDRRPRAASGTPHTSARYAPARRVRAASCVDQRVVGRRRCGPRPAGPDVPTSRRCTMPGRCGSPDAGQLRVAGEQPVDERARRRCRRPGARRGRPACRPR